MGMKKIIIYGNFLEYNLGLPSLLHGVEELLSLIYKKEETELIYYESDTLKGKIAGNFKSQIKYFPFKNSKKMLKEALRYKFLKKCEKNAEMFFKDIETADYVVDIYGICFCSNIEKNPMSYLKAIYSSVMGFTPAYIAKHFFNVKTVKTASSYGPVDVKGLPKKAEFTLNKIFDNVFAREEESKNVILDNCKINKKINVTPDLANLMQFEKTEYGKHHKIGISVSHQLECQWKDDKLYRDSVVSLIEHIKENNDKCKIILIPNETSPLKKRNDIDVAKDIFNAVNDKNGLSVYDNPDFDAVKLKNEIATMDLMISSRYHSCVASLSSGIPTLVMGWHYKYEELLSIYNQSKWIIKSPKEISELNNKFDELWNKRYEINNELKSIYKQITEKLYSLYKEVFL